MNSVPPKIHLPISSVLGLVMTSVPRPGCSEILLSYTCQLNGFPFFSQRYLKYNGVVYFDFIAPYKMEEGNIKIYGIERISRYCADRFLDVIS